MKIAASEWRYHQQKMTEMTTLLQDAKKNSQTNAELIKKLQSENEQLREIMRGYAQQIDELSKQNLQLVVELEKCEDM